MSNAGVLTAHFPFINALFELLRKFIKSLTCQAEADNTDLRGTCLHRCRIANPFLLL